MTEQDPPWLRLARFELGTRELAGLKSNTRIDQYHSYTRAGVPGADADSVPWCSSFLCWAFEQSDIRSTKSKAAKSWLDWGYELPEPRLGCVVVMERGKGKFHVTLYDGPAGEKHFCGLGGNQNNQVTRARYPLSRVESLRWPETP
jgi:uncharacterized protein (TIGR02594 family)